MLNFELYNPTNYIFGKNQIEKLANLIPAHAKVLLAYGGGSIFKNGIHKQVTEHLKGFEVIEFGGIEPNPRFETLMKAVEIIRTEKITFILAVGGGSVIDGVKFISGAVNYEGNAVDILKNRILFKDILKVIPFGTILTLPATGSEMNSGAVITIEATQEKLTLGGSALFPQFSICDPTVIQSLPKRQLQNGVVDAFTHVLEQYMTYSVDAKLQDRLAESILQTLIEVAPAILKDPSDYKAASNFMWSCTMALNGLIQQGVPSDWAIHMMGHELTALFGIDHARTLAIIAESHYKYNLESKKDKLAQYAERVWKIEGGTTEEKALAGIKLTTAFFHSLGIKTTLSEYTEEYEGTAQIISKRFEERGWKGIGEHGKVTPIDVQKIVEMSY